MTTEFATDVGSKPQLEAPTLANLSQRIAARPYFLADQPLEVEAETFNLARQEMKAIQAARGFPLATAAIKRPNFLLRGVPVIAKDQA